MCFLLCINILVNHDKKQKTSEDKCNAVKDKSVQVYFA